ncbi:glycosyltransferase family 9 protein [Geomonas sp. Red32]|uniref:glycosyltransferase family 9 protein n=1 Tax=Geomonas sp. Red32 TaxID=2912856 RepID=UPI00202CD1A3|nr:glycosyltransferase family 9 protein [Geomonas sp. Red32]MCM0083500.1 glycosyltransferase family 9 protein [Geomonas sp. Red32]
MSRIKILKKVDAVLGIVGAALLPSARERQHGEIKRILVIRPGGIGDAVLLVPALNALKSRYPDAEVTVLAERRNAAAFALAPAVAKVLLYDEASPLAEAVRGSYDLVIDTEQWHRLSAIVARLAGAPVSVGFATNNRKRLFAHRIPYSHERYEVESFFDLLSPLGIEQPGSLEIPFLTVPEAAAAKAADLLPAGRPYLAIFPGASIPERRWGMERFRRVADHLSLRGLSIVVVGGEEDAEEGAYIVKWCGGTNLAGKTTLAETAAVIARSLLLVSGDSGVLHLAVGLGIPTVSLFGPGIEAKWGPRGEFDLVLNKKLACSPCTRFGTTPACREKARCLTDIAPNEVVDAVMTVLDRRFPA